MSAIIIVLCSERNMHILTTALFVVFQDGKIQKGRSYIESVAAFSIGT
jgi:hypothetical protein